MSWERRIRPQSLDGWRTELCKSVYLTESIDFLKENKFLKQQETQALARYLIITHHLHDHWEAVVTGGCVAEDVHDGSHLLYFVQPRTWGTHHLSG